MSSALAAPGLAGMTRLLVLREVRAKLASLWFHLVATAICLGAFVHGTGFQGAFATEGVVVSTNPLLALDVAVVVFLAVVLGLRLATAIAWEREHRTLEVLLVGPVPWSVVVVAKFVVELTVLVLLVAVYAAYLVLAQPLGRGVVAPGDMAGPVLMALFALPCLALGLAVSAIARTVRGAVVAFLAIVGCLAAYEIALAILHGRPAEEMSLAALYVRAMLEAVAPVVRAASPVAVLAGLAEGLVAEAPFTARALASALAMAAVLLVAAVLLARSRGAT